MPGVESIFVSDLHIGRGEPNDARYAKIDDFIDFIKEEKPAFLGLIGDIGDPYEKEWQEILNYSTWGKLKELVAERKQNNLRTVWIHENHDYHAEPLYLPGAELKRGTVDLKKGDPGNPGDYTIKLRHGWQWDVFWGGIQGWIPGLAGLLFYIQENHPRLARWLNDLYRLPKKIGVKPRTPSTQKQIAKRTPREKEEWDLGMIWVHGHARKWAIKKKAMLIFGHTHYPDFQIDMTGQTGVINTGDWVDSYSYVVYEQNKLHPELRRWP